MNRRRYRRDVVCKDIRQAVVVAADGCVATLLADTYIHIGLRGCLKRVVSGTVCRQEAAKILKFEDISLRPKYNLRRSLAFQTTSERRIDLAYPSLTTGCSPSM